MDDDITIHIDTLTIDLTPDAAAALLTGDHDVLAPAILAALHEIPSGTHGRSVHQRPSSPFS
jgi:hypothetical protein